MKKPTQNFQKTGSVPGFFLVEVNKCFVGKQTNNLHNAYCYFLKYFLPDMQKLTDR